MTGIVRHFYAGGNTARGFASMLDSSLQRLDRVWVLQGHTGTGKLMNLQDIGNQLAGGEYDIWFVHCASDKNALDALIIPSLKIGIVDGTSPRYEEPAVLGEAVRYVNISDACDQDQLDATQPEIGRLMNGIEQAYASAYAGFAEALRIHDDWEQIYIANMNFQAADELAGEYIELLFGDLKSGVKLERPGEARTDLRFLGAATPEGAVDYIPQLTNGLKRYLLKGRPGSGKSTMLKKLATSAAARGYDTEIYHCGFDPGSLDMVIVRELGFAIFDSTAPHEYFPDRPSDEIVDMYERCLPPGTDETNAQQISLVQQRYSAAMKQSIRYLAEARALLDQLELTYIRSMDMEIIEQLKDELRQEMNRVAIAASRS